MKLFIFYGFPNCFYYRSLGYAPFSEDSDSLLTVSPKVDESTKKPKIVKTKPTSLSKLSVFGSRDNFSLVINLGHQNVDRVNNQVSNDRESFVKVTPTMVNNKIRKLDLSLKKTQNISQNQKISKFEELLNQLSIDKQRKFLEQFSKLNPSQQNYAYSQFISSPIDVQQFALKQFLSLEPEVLIVSIDRELETEDTEINDPNSSENAIISNEEFIDSDPILTIKKVGAFKAASPKQINQKHFQTNFKSNVINFKPITSSHSPNVINTQFFQMGPFR